MTASGWKGATYGVRVGKANAARYFPKNWNSIIIELDGVPHQFDLSDTFWSTCPEVRGASIGLWFERRGLIPWPARKPPKVELIQLGGNRFRLQ